MNRFSAKSSIITISFSQQTLVDVSANVSLISGIGGISSKWAVVSFSSDIISFVNSPQLLVTLE
jgi:hypothetical protein